MTQFFPSAVRITNIQGTGTTSLAGNTGVLGVVNNIARNTIKTRHNITIHRHL